MGIPSLSKHGLLSPVTRAGSMIAAGLIMLGVAAAPIAGQTGGLTVEPRVGVSLPAGALRLYLEPGPTVGLRAAYPVGEGVSLTADGAFDLLPGDARFRNQPGEIRLPEMRILQYLGGVDVALLPVEPQKVLLIGEVGLGARTFNSDNFTPPTRESTAFKHTYIAASGGARLGVPVTQRIDLAIGGKLIWSPVKSEDTASLAALAHYERFDRALTLPLHVSLRARL